MFHIDMINMVIESNQSKNQNNDSILLIFLIAFFLTNSLIKTIILFGLSIIPNVNE